MKPASFAADLHVFGLSRRRNQKEDAPQNGRQVEAEMADQREAKPESETGHETKNISANQRNNQFVFAKV